MPLPIGMYLSDEALSCPAVGGFLYGVVKAWAMERCQGKLAWMFRLG